MTSSHQIPWLSLEDAAKRISRSTGKPCSEADVLAAALEGYITISIQSKSKITARAGQFQERYREAPFGVSSKKLLYAGVGCWGNDGDPFAYASSKPEHIEGLLDVILIGQGKTIVENIMHGIVDDDDDDPMSGIYLQGPTGNIWEIQNEIVSGEHRDHDHEGEYLPAERFPGDWCIVVRTSALDRFIEECQQDAQKVSEDNITVAALSLISGKYPDELLKDAAAYQRELTKVNQSPKNTLPTTSQVYLNDNFVTLKSVVESTGKPYQDILCLARDNHESLRLLVLVNYCDLVRSPPSHEYTDECGYFALPWVCFNSILKNDRIKIDRVIPLPGGNHIGVGQLDVGLQRQDRDAVGAISVLGEPDIYELPRDLGKLYFFKDQADKFFSLEETQPTADKSKPVAPDVNEQDLEKLKVLPGAMENATMPQLLKIFGYGEGSRTGIETKVSDYNRRYPELPINFHAGKGGAKCLYHYEAWFIRSKVGEASGRRKSRKSSKNKP